MREEAEEQPPLLSAVERRARWLTSERMKLANACDKILMRVTC